MSEYCIEAMERLYLFLDGELGDPQVAERIKAHLAECPPCDGTFSFEQRLRIVVRERLQEEVPHTVIERIRTVLRTET